MRYAVCGTHPPRIPHPAFRIQSPSPVQIPTPLAPGTILSNRFEIQSVLGRGGFAIAYQAHDHVRQDDATIKELAPMGSVREADGLLNLNDPNPLRLRDRFLDEARTLARLDLPGVLPVRATFVENGTAYFATDYIWNSESLQNLLDRESKMDPDGALDVFFQLLETLEALHAKRILHRDIKPSNILLAPDGHAILIDFGAAREWLADVSHRQTILFTPGYAPLEQLAERAARGPATDLYALCATLYHMLTGQPPLPAAGRAAGEELTPVDRLRPGLDPSVVKAIEAGLALKFGERPQTAERLRALFTEPDSTLPHMELAAYDKELVRLKQFRFDRRGCPSCGEPMDEPKPLKKGACPVCHEGFVKQRLLSDRQCPVCKMGALHLQKNSAPLSACPNCKLGKLAAKRKSLLKPELSLTCQACNTVYESQKDGMSPADKPDEFKTWDDWRALSGRSIEIWHCDSCDAQFDALPDGRRKLVTKAKDLGFDRLYPEEWARVAAGLDPGAGNAVCNACEADYFVDDASLTLLGAKEDTFGFAEYQVGRHLDLEDVRWLAVGKESPNHGLVCPKCDTELDRDSDFFRLVRSHNPHLSRYIGEPFTFEDWHRIAQGLPTIGDEGDFQAGIESAIAQAYVEGHIGFDNGNDLLWKGPASLDDQEATLTITAGEIVFGGLLRKDRRPLDALTAARGQSDTLTLTFRGSTEPVEYEIDPMELSVVLESGPRTVVLNAEHLAARLSST